VLVVDDVLMNRDVAASFLRVDGHDVTCVEGGAQAVQAAATTDFDVVLMDVRMPEIDGLEATRRIRALGGERGRVPIVALTAQSFTDQVEECRNAGMNGHLAKPFTPESLLAALAQAVSTGRPQGADPGSAGVPSSLPTCAANPVEGSDLPLIDSKAFERVAVRLTPAMVSGYLAEIGTMGANLAEWLRGQDALTSNAAQLAAMAHKLAGSAGMLGFERLASLSRRFERAIETGADDGTAIAIGLCGAIEATGEEIQRRTPLRPTAPASCPAHAGPR
jgi:hypothetical protein